MDLENQSSAVECETPSKKHRSYQLIKLLGALCAVSVCLHVSFSAYIKLNSLFTPNPTKRNLLTSVHSNDYQLSQDSNDDYALSPTMIDIDNALSFYSIDISYVQISSIVAQVKSNKQPIYKINNNEYEFIKLLGGGTFGNVFLATSLKTKNKFAIKLQDVTTEDDWYAAHTEMTVANEIKQYASDHPTNNLCHVYEMTELFSYELTEIENIHTFAMVLQYFPDGDLHKFQVSTDVETDEKAALQQVGLLLKHVGINGLKIINDDLKDDAGKLLYYDIKPGNILVELNDKEYIDKFTLTDFGLVSSELAERGTLDYLNPISASIYYDMTEEQENEVSEIIGVNPEGIIDIYGLAAVAFQFYTWVGCDTKMSIQKTVNNQIVAVPVNNALCKAAYYYNRNKADANDDSTTNPTIFHELRQRAINYAFTITNWGENLTKEDIEILPQYQLAKFFHLAFSIQTRSKTLLKKLNWDYVKEVVNYIENSRTN